MRYVLRGNATAVEAAPLENDDQTMAVIVNGTCVAIPALAFQRLFIDEGGREPEPMAESPVVATPSRQPKIGKSLDPRAGTLKAGGIPDLICKLLGKHREMQTEDLVEAVIKAKKRAHPNAVRWAIVTLERRGKVEQTNYGGVPILHLKKD